MLQVLVSFIIGFITLNKQEHPDLNKAEKKRLCRILDCQKLSPEVRSHAVKNERLPLRTVVQLLYFEQERGSTTANDSKLSLQDLIPKGKITPTQRNDQGKLKLGSDEKHNRGEGTKSTAVSESGEKDNHRMKRSEGKLPLELEKKTSKGEIEEVEAVKGGVSTRKMTQKGSSRSEHGRDRGRDR